LRRAAAEYQHGEVELLLDDARAYLTLPGRQIIRARNKASARKSWAVVSVILVSYDPNNIGNRYIGVRDIHCVWHPLPALVLREATAQDWTDGLVEHLGYLPEHDQRAGLSKCYFHEVSTD
jgi:hypothetical protein